MPVEDVFYFEAGPWDDVVSGWYFWDIDGLSTDGPFDTEEEATEARQTYLLVTRQENE
jgi:hypothetical protein